MATTLRSTKDTLAEISKLQHQGKKIVFTNGCFDILHPGHIRYLRSAKMLGDVLVVGLNSDLSVKNLKGPLRPVLNEAERQELLEALRSVDFVCVFNEPTPLELIRLVKPDVLVKGGDWPVEKIVGNDIVRARGGQTLSLPFEEGHSTTDVIERVRRMHQS